MRSFEKSLKKPNKGKENKIPDIYRMCIDCNRRVTFDNYTVPIMTEELLFCC